MQGETIVFPANCGPSGAVRSTVGAVYGALVERGYDPVGQLAGYLLTGDPTYITAHGRARVEIQRIDRVEIVEEMVRVYLNCIHARS